ncbi:protein adenylyltransferase SelO [Methylocucumis oryzae]|uniref:Protein nucleotidyltransferase YdiU n=1 Tax=Methylocucumis oryzae TaxID=1632867 RepID=A0A0F3IEC7_9GAMM|nr:YdiU family protein [Methylocucumis oryzae]KJV05150.1 hypothetical protein VZ94_20260 [Methylocucumis oryzae]
MLTDLEQLTFDNRFVAELPGDTETINTRRQVYNACYSKVLPTPVKRPTLVAYAREVAEFLQLSPELCCSEAFVQVFSGNQLLPDMQPHATCYGGHQFGSWAGQLGDGRAINLGDVVNQQGQRWTLQLKGAGPTPYSRTADGLAVLRSSIREFLCSEAMHHLGVPTTRALSVIATGEYVVRDMFYDGNPKAEPGAIVCRVAPSFTRFGHFQILTARKDLTLLKRLLDYTIATDFAELKLDLSSETAYLDWFAEVCQRTAAMIVHWQRVGFVHGVMNTDNMSILGLTIDYGPYGWLENYDLNWTPNTTDAGERRYRYGNQPAIAFWNLAQLANAIYPLLGEERLAELQATLDTYKRAYEQGWQVMMVDKLGLGMFNGENDMTLCTDLIELLQAVETDMTIFFRRLALIPLHADASDELLIEPLLDAYYVKEQLDTAYLTQLYAWLRQYQTRLKASDQPLEQRRQRMNAVNPKYVLRNYLAQLAIDKAEQGDYRLVNELLEVLRRPYDEQAEQETYAAKRPDWARQRAGCSMLSCSS